MSYLGEDKNEESFLNQIKFVFNLGSFFFRFVRERVDIDISEAQKIAVTDTRRVKP